MLAADFQEIAFRERSARCHIEDVWYSEIRLLRFTTIVISSLVTPLKTFRDGLFSPWMSL
jgi:hypothetical protein